MLEWAMRSWREVGILLLLILLAGWHGGRQWQECWDDQLLLRRPSKLWCNHEFLEIEADSYRRIVADCRRGTYHSRVEDRGRLTLSADRLRLHSDQGRVSEFELTQKDQKWVLSGPDGHYEQAPVYGPRLHASRHWLQPDKPLTIAGVCLGMTREQVNTKLAPDFPSLGIEGRNHFRAPGDRQLIIIRFDDADRVRSIEGNVLEQEGRTLLNYRSNRGDVEALWGEPGWRGDAPSQERTSASVALRSPQQKLTVSVFPRSGERPGESPVVSLKLHYW